MADEVSCVVVDALCLYLRESSSWRLFLFHIIAAAYVDFITF